MVVPYSVSLWRCEETWWFPRPSKPSSPSSSDWRVRFPSTSAMSGADKRDDPRSAIARTDEVLADARLAAAGAGLRPATVKAAVNNAQKAARLGMIPIDAVVETALAALPRSPTSLRPVLNATGVVLHTNLGRAPLSRRAREALDRASGYVDVELDVATGRRARRGRATIEALKAAVPSAEDAHVVNNGAAALALVAAAFGQGREIIVSRGELIEIGDGFRLPELIASLGARLHEVGTTNRTTLRDYEAAIGDDTALVLKVHTSNFVMRGFTASVPVNRLAGLGPPVAVDIGSGLLAPEPLLPAEPDAESMLRAGATVVTASGDKLLGGPQAGVLLGCREAIEMLRRHPLARAFRAGKLTFAALEATLLDAHIPVEEYLRADPGRLRSRAVQLANSLRASGVQAAAVISGGAAGGGSAPAVELPGWAVSLPASMAAALRAGHPCVIGRLERDRCLLDLRCIPAESDSELESAVRQAASRIPSGG